MKHPRYALVVLSLVIAVQPIAAQQAEKPAPAAQTQKTTALSGIPLRVVLVLSKYKGEKKISSLPYTISATTDRRAQLRVGADVPYATTRVPAKPAGDGKQTDAPEAHNYRTVGTSIDCTATSTQNGGFRLDIAINDSSISYAEDSNRPQGVPVFRSFSTTNSLFLKDGETGQVTTAADPITGEVLRVDVTLTVVK